jgi:hypothetical protein
LGRLHLPRNLHVDFYTWHKSVRFQTHQNFEWASELFRKFFTSSRCYLHWYLPKCGADIDGLILKSLHPSVCLVEIKHVSLRASSGNNVLNYKS